jgi:hypothetical protein
MRPDTRTAADPTTAHPPRTRLARLVRGLSLATFLAAAACMLLAGALHSAGRAGASAVLATIGYALGVAGITAGVLALAVDQPIDPQPAQETS